MYSNKKIFENNKYLCEKLNDKDFLIVAHRGSSKGNIIENSVLSTKVAFLEGADIVELDVIRSKDNVFYAFHDGTEIYLTGKNYNFLNMTSKEIEYCDIYNKIAGVSGYRIQKLSAILEYLLPGQLVNIDRSWNYWDTLLDYFDNFDVKDKIILKSHPEDKFLKQLHHHPVKYMYFPIVKTIEQIEKVKSYSEINLVGFELIAETDKSELFDAKLIENLKKDGYFAFANAERISGETDLFAGFDDDKSIISGYDTGWGVLLELGINVVQTDWTHLLNAYRKERNRND